MKGWKDKLVCVSQTVEYQSMEEREREKFIRIPFSSGEIDLFVRE